MWLPDSLPTSPPIVVDSTAIQDSLMIGSRTYELTNHLGNVLSTISDKKIGNDSSGTVNYYIAEVLSQNDYYPGGMLEPERQYSLGGYRYGFNGKENDNEVKGEGNQQDYGMRIYDPRLGRFLSVDPLLKDFPFYTPYHFAGNSPLKNVDLAGGEDLPYYHADYYRKYHSKVISSYTTTSGNPATVYEFDDNGKNYLVTQVTTRETVKDAFGYIHGVSYYFVEDKKLVNDNDKTSNDGKYVFKTRNTHMHFWMTNNDLSIQAKQTDGVIKILGGFTYTSFAMPYLIPGAIMTAPYVEQAGRFTFQILKPKLGVNISGASWDLINQKVFQGRSWRDVNWGSTITAGSFGGGNVLSNALWGASGSFTNLSINNISHGGNLTQLNTTGLRMFTTNAIGNLVSGTSNYYLKSLNNQVTGNEFMRNLINQTFGFTSEATGQFTSNVIEKKLDKPRK
jgi:RHS repeat-associated protein